MRPLPTAPTITSHKRDSVTSSDSGVGSHPVFSPTLPITPEHLPQHSHKTANEQPSNSVATRRLTSLQQFLRNSRKAEIQRTKAPQTSAKRPQFSNDSLYSHSLGLQTLTYNSLSFSYAQLHSSSETTFPSQFFFFYFLCKMPKCHKIYPNFQWSVTNFCQDLALGTMLLTKIYWSFLTKIVPVCSHLFYNIHFNGISSASVISK